MVQQRGRRGAGRRCLVEGCRRLVRPGWAVCRRHARTADGAESTKAVREMADRATATAVMVAAGAGERASGEFARRLARGDYGALLDAPVRDIVRQAGEEAALTEEIGALRLAVKRLLVEEADASKMALGISRAAHALARLLREEARRKPPFDIDDPQMQILASIIAVDEDEA